MESTPEMRDAVHAVLQDAQALPAALARISQIEQQNAELSRHNRRLLDYIEGRLKWKDIEELVPRGTNRGG